MIELSGDKDGFAGKYQGEGYSWEVSKFYFGKGLGAGWKVAGPFFGAEKVYNWNSIRSIVENWKEQGVEKVA